MQKVLMGRLEWGRSFEKINFIQLVRAGLHEVNPAHFKRRVLITVTLLRQIILQ